MPTEYLLRTIDGRDYAVGTSASIGRDPSCQVMVSDDPRISRVHARLWVDGSRLMVSDENSSNGTFVNGDRLAPSQPRPLRLGDKLRVGSTQFEVLAVTEPGPTFIGSPLPMPAAPVARRRPTWLLGCGLLSLGGILLLCFAGAALFVWRSPGALPGLLALGGPATPPVSSGVGAANIIASAETPPLLTTSAYASSNEELVAAITRLNQDELAFVRAATGQGGYQSGHVLARLAYYQSSAAELDPLLRQIAADGMGVARIAGDLSRTAAAQDGGSDQAGQTASIYGSIFRLGAALVIDVQNTRAGLAEGTLTSQAAAEVIAEYGARLWSPAADPTASGNPFTAYTADPNLVAQAAMLSADATAQFTADLGGPLTAWVAASPERVTKKLSVPGLGASGVNPSDPAIQTRLETADGQTDAKAAWDVAAAIIQAGGGIDPSTDQTLGGEVVAAFWSQIAVTGQQPSGAAPETLPAYPNGSGTAVTIIPEAHDIVSTIVAMDGSGEPAVTSRTTVQETTPVVSLTISNLVINQINKRPKDAFNTFEADVVYEFDVTWTSSLVAPQFALDCVSGNRFDITAAGGSQHISAKGLLILYPGAEDAYCYASRNGNTFGSASVHFLVGDAAQATQRAIQVETDSASLDLTLTADAQGTLGAEQTQAAQTQAVLGTQNALETEVGRTQTAEFRATVTEIARRTENAPPPTLTETPQPTPTFTPLLVDTFSHPGNLFAVSSRVVLQRGRLYRVCFSGEVHVVDPDRSVPANEMEHVNGIAVPPSGCLTLEGNGAVASVTCGTGEPAEEPGGFTIQIWDLGPF